MDLTPYVDHLRHELAVAANAGGDEARALAERLTTPLESAVRLMLLNALSAASDEITRELAPGSVDVRLRGLDPEFVVTTPPGAEHPVGEAPIATAPMAPAVAPSMAPSGDSEEGATARINFRLPAPLKARVEEAAGREGLSVNAWLVRAVAGALEPGGEPARPAARAPRYGQSYRGWVR
ncbi:hypothetical protein I3F58_19765 [Streptomyces sp. MUM 203J]|uniref:hypothetical protein n=1 Tax=Streptomyces sp. MUM 203J TaxID=2791990 RepID=UPI001F037954|nr:hypothetical protein [Streptomyces sp. MUM 203J]MCH0541761.1 hypothetical protein [Streptomyces sp. MUM 203J]